MRLWIVFVMLMYFLHPRLLTLQIEQQCPYHQFMTAGIASEWLYSLAVYPIKTQPFAADYHNRISLSWLVQKSSIVLQLKEERRTR